MNKFEELTNHLSRHLKNGRSKETTNTVIAMSYLLMKEKEEGLLDYQKTLKLANKIDKELMQLIESSVTEQSWNEAIKDACNYSNEDYKEVVLGKGVNSKNEEEETPESITNLAKALLDCKETDVVADFCCGKGSFLLSCGKEQPNGKYVGIDIQQENALIIKLRANVRKTKIQVETQNIFDMENNKKSYDRIFANYPFGQQIKQVVDQTSLERILKGMNKDIRLFGKAEWLYNCVIRNQLKETGKAVVVMTSGSMFSVPEKAFREYFVENGMIETVIALPERLFERTLVPVTMVVMSYGNKKVRMVDARNICTANHRMNVLTEKDIKEILNAVKQETEYGKDITAKEIEKNDYSLYVNRYLVDEVELENGVKFESVIKNISRGTAISSNQLDEMMSEEETNMKYLLLNQINDGMIDEELKNLKYIDEKNKKYCVHNNNLVISKISVPVKTAVANIPEGQLVLASGNMYIVELDETKVNPYFIKAFFDSEQGQAVLRKNMVAGTIHTISVESLTNLMIPLPPLEEQEKIAKKYKDVQEEIKEYRHQLKEAVGKLSTVYLNK